MNYFYFVITCFLICSCSSVKEDALFYQISLEEENELVIEYPNLYYPIYPNFRIENGKKYLAIYETQKRQILSFSMEDGQLLQATAADFNPSGKQHLYSFHYHNDD